MTRGQQQSGLTLVELLVALALLALISTLMIHGTLSWSRLADRATAATERAVESAIEVERLRYVIEGVIPAWPQEKEVAFLGTEDRIEGLTRRPLLSNVPSLVSFNLMLETRAGGQAVILYRDNYTEAVVAELPGQPSFRYLDWRGNWHNEWPPVAANAQQRSRNPGLQVPQIISVRYGQEMLLLRVGSWPALPDRQSDGMVG